MNLIKKLQSRIDGLIILSNSSERVLPGVVLDDEDSMTVSDELQRLFPNESSSKFELMDMDANFLIAEKNTGSFDFGVEGSISSIAKPKAEISLGYSMDIELTDVKAKALKNIHKNELKIMFRKLKFEDKQNYKLIKWDYIVRETYYASGFKVVFKRNNSILAEAEVNQKFNIDAKGSLKWSNDGVLTVSNNDKVPFAFAGFKIGSE